MNQLSFSDPKELIAAFEIPGDAHYSRITTLGDRKVGFSVQSHYPPDIRFSPPKNKLGEDDVVALIHVVYVHPQETKGAFNSSKVPIIVQIRSHSRYRESHFDYDFSNDNCPTRESLERSKKTPSPTTLEYHNDFFYDHTAHRFIDKQNCEIRGIGILDYVFTEHCKTTGLIRSFGIRTRKKTQWTVIGLLGGLVDKLIWIQKNVFGRELDESVSLSQSITGYRREDFKKLNTESFDVLGYKASKAVIIIFSFLTFVGYAIKFRTGLSTPYLRAIFSNSFLALTHSILVVWFLDLILPNLLFFAINGVIKFRAWVMFGPQKK